VALDKQFRFPRPSVGRDEKLSTATLQNDSEFQMVRRKVLIVLGAGLLLVSGQHLGILQAFSGEQAVLRTGQVFRERMKIGTDGPEMIVISAGKFRMGDIQGRGLKVEQPVHEVHIRRPFAVSRYEITFDQYDEFARVTGRQLPDDEGFGRGRRPVIRVSWNEAVEYTAWLSQQTGKHYRLPTEAEWEYAARGGTVTAYWWGNEMKPGFANCESCGTPPDKIQTMPVGSFQPNPFGLYDTVGNVREWVEDCWHDSYQGAPSDGSAWEKEQNGTCNGRVHRGGSFRGVNKNNLSSSSRDKARAGARPYWVGFRLVREIE
jgi:formylglycine-generating enzyme required for sulfatase activity